MTSEAIKIIESNPGLTYKQFFEELRKKLPSTEYDQTPQLEGKEADKKRKLFTNDVQNE